MRISDFKLSKPQERTFKKLIKVGDWQTAYSLQESRNTLDSLVEKGLVTRKRELGSLFDPRTAIYYKTKYRIVSG